jgi:hypothetical protein
MAAPHVTGALALVLSHRHKQQGQPQHDARQLLVEVIKTAKNFTLHHAARLGGSMPVQCNNPAPK